MAHPGTLHSYSRNLTAFEHASPSPSPSPTNLILWLGGLGDGPLSVTYPSSIATSLPPTWTLAEVLLSSSYSGWGTGSLSRDATELGKCVAYFKTLRPGAKIVLMGHSTGCQDIMEYLVGGNKQFSDEVDGAILQAGVSDREGWGAMAEGDEELQRSLREVLEEAGGMVGRGEGDEVMARKGRRALEMFGGACTAYRVHSMLAVGGDDDYFSTDLGEERLRETFGRVPERTKVMFLWGGEDPYVPRGVDKEGTLRRWAGFVKEGGGRVDEVNGGVVRGASHNLNGDEEGVVEDLVGRVVRFVEGL